MILFAFNQVYLSVCIYIYIDTVYPLRYVQFLHQILYILQHCNNCIIDVSLFKYINILNPIESYSDKIGTPQNQFHRNGLECSGQFAAKVVHPKWRNTPLSKRLVKGVISHLHLD